MSYSTYLTAILASLVLAPRTEGRSGAGPATLDDAWAPALEGVRHLLEAFNRDGASPPASAQLEKDLEETLRAVGRAVLEWTYNHLEPDDTSVLPERVTFEGNGYRRLARKTPQNLSTLFGTIRLHRLGYRAPASVGEPVLFPLCRELGVVHSVTPALLERIGHYLAETGATQQQTLARLRAEHGVSWGVKRLRQVAEFLAGAMEEQRLEAQTEQVLRWLQEAEASRGRHRPVLCVGRDGITLSLRIKKGCIYEVATVATLTVYDRRGQRLGTVYLAQPPESGQATMSGQLTELLRAVFVRWQGPLPRLSYVTDAGDNETAYYRKVLRQMRHPVTRQRLPWHRVVDYYHASERLWTMAEALFGKGQKSYAWARKMQKLLLRPSGVSRVLHSAGALRNRRHLTGKRLTEFQKAYQYLQGRRRYLRYAVYRRLGMPIGSGVTEAACKTVFTQRLKLSGMRWQKEGARTILRLRVLLLSGVWSPVYERTLKSYSRVQTGTPARPRRSKATKAA